MSLFTVTPAAGERQAQLLPEKADRMAHSRQNTVRRCWFSQRQPPLNVQPAVGLSNASDEAAKMFSRTQRTSVTCWLDLISCHQQAPGSRRQTIRRAGGVQYATNAAPR